MTGRWAVAGQQSRGPRRQQNDAYYTSSTFLAVADGVGEEAGSGRAAFATVETYRESAKAAPDGGWMEEAAHSAADRLSADGIAAATTISAVELAPGGRLWCSNLGDSRTMVIRPNGDAHRLVYLSPQHNAAAEGSDDPRARHRLTKWVSAAAPSSEPERCLVEVDAGDVVIVTSDGVHEVLDNDGLAAIALSLPPVDAVAEIVWRVEAANQTDNATVCVARVNESGGSNV